MPPRAPTAPARFQTEESTISTSQNEAKPHAAAPFAGQNQQTSLYNNPYTTSSIPPMDYGISQSSLQGAFNSPYGGIGGYGGGMGGYGGGSMYGGMMSPYGGMNMMGGPVNNLNQLLFGVQNVIFSLTQAVQIIGMNTEAVKKLLEHATGMFEHAVATWNEMQVLERAHRDEESPEQLKRRRRLRALRWLFVATVTFAGYKVVNWLVQKSMSPRRLRTAEGRVHP